MRRTIANLLVVFTACASYACSPACDTSDEAHAPTVYDAGKAVNGVYFSSSAHGNLLDFSGGKRYDVVHHLGFEPIQVQLFWSFKSAGIGTYEQNQDTGNLTTGVGNSAEIQLKNDQFIRVKNDSCADFWLLVVASGDPREMDGSGEVVDAAAE